MKKIKIMKSSATHMRKTYKDIVSMKNNCYALIVYYQEIIKIMRYVLLIKLLRLKETF